jgi:hypothetical protein
VGDPVIVTGNTEFEGKTGEIEEFSPSGKFVIVNLYNYGRHSMHLSDVALNQYDVDESSMSEIDTIRQDLDRMTDQQFLRAYKISKQKFKQDYDTLLRPAPNQDTPLPNPKFRDAQNRGFFEAQTDYQKRRQREKDIDAGKTVAKQRQPRMTDYQKRRAQQKKELELGESTNYWNKLQEERRRKAYSYLNELEQVFKDIK